MLDDLCWVSSMDLDSLPLFNSMNECSLREKDNRNFEYNCCTSIPYGEFLHQNTCFNLSTRIILWGFKTSYI